MRLQVFYVAITAAVMLEPRVRTSAHRRGGCGRVAGRWLASTTKCNTLSHAVRVGRNKADRNARKHGVTFEEAATVDPLALIIEDESHPENARVIGESLGAHILLVVFVERDRDHVRLISARRATRHERRL